VTILPARTGRARPVRGLTAQRAAAEQKGAERSRQAFSHANYVTLRRSL
jgi:hypothetical protein